MIQSINATVKHDVQLPRMQHFKSTILVTEIRYLCVTDAVRTASRMKSLYDMQDIYLMDSDED